MMLKKLTAAVIAASLTMVTFIDDSMNALIPVNIYAESVIDEVLLSERTPSGDINSDGLLSISDALIMQKWLLGSDEYNYTDLKAIDFCTDGIIDVFDFIVLRKKLIQTINIPVAVSINITGGFLVFSGTYKIPYPHLKVRENHTFSSKITRQSHEIKYVYAANVLVKKSRHKKYFFLL